jgi:hypothetical protein
MTRPHTILSRDRSAAEVIKPSTSLTVCVSCYAHISNVSQNDGTLIVFLLLNF